MEGQYGFHDFGFSATSNNGGAQPAETHTAPPQTDNVVQQLTVLYNSTAEQEDTTVGYAGSPLVHHEPQHNEQITCVQLTSNSTNGVNDSLLEVVSPLLESESHLELDKPSGIVRSNSMSSDGTDTDATVPYKRVAISPSKSKGALKAFPPSEAPSPPVFEAAVADVAGPVLPRKMHYPYMPEPQILPIEPPAVFKCHLCPKEYPLSGSLSRHLHGHHEPGHLDCFVETCDLTFTTETHRGQHVDWSHADLDRLQCWFCPHTVQVKRRSNLIAHMRTHLSKEDRPFKCMFMLATGEQCGETFVQKSQLIYHERSAHTHERPYTCPQCQQTYISGGDLNSHVRAHHT